MGERKEGRRGREAISLPDKPSRFLLAFEL